MLILKLLPVFLNTLKKNKNEETPLRYRRSQSIVIQSYRLSELSEAFSRTP